MLTTIAQIWSVIQGLVQMLGAFLLMIAKGKADTQKEAIEQAAENLKQTNKVVDDEARLKAKAEAACRLEMASNPDTDCAAPVDSSQLQK